MATLIAGLLFWGWHRSGGRRVEIDGAAVAPGQSVEEVQDVSAAAARPIVPDEAPEPQAVIVGGLPSDSVRPAKRLLSGHRDPVNSVAFAPDSTMLASGSFDAIVRLWNGVTGDALGVLEGHEDRVESVAFSPDGATLASGGRDRTIRLWDARTGQAGMTLDGARSTVFMVAFSPDGTTLAGGEENGEVTLWDCASGALRQRFQAHDGPVWSTAFSPDGLTLATGGVDRRVRFWNATNGAPRRAMIGHTEAVHSVAFSPDGTFLASSGRDRTIRIWRVSDGRLMRQWSTGATIGHALAYARRGNGLVSANEDGTLSLWNALTGTLVTNLMGHSGVVHSVAFAPDGRTLASGGHDQNVGLWDWEQWTEALPELSEFTELFNGHDLSGWRGYSRYWTVQDGILTGSVPPGETLKTFLVWGGPPLGNFELRFVFRSEEGNSGVFFRAQEPKEDQVEGYQYEIWSDQTGGLIDVRNSGERRDLAPLGQRTVATDSRGIMLVHLVQTLAKPSMNRRTNPDGGWNEGVIIAEGNRIVQRLNGLTSSAVLDIDPTRGLSRGLLALELYGDGERRRAVQFKSIRLRRF